MRQVRGVLAVRRRAEQAEPDDQDDDRGGVGWSEATTEHEHAGHRGDADAAGDCGLDDEQWQRAQRDDRGDEADGVERESAQIRNLAAQAREQHDVEVTGRGCPSRARGLQDRAEPVAEVGRERADQCEEHRPRSLRAGAAGWSAAPIRRQRSSTC